MYRAAFPAGHILKPTFTIKCGNVWMNHVFLNNTCTALTKQQFDINPHNLLNWDFHTTRWLVYKHTFCQNGMSTKKNCFFLNFHKNITCLKVGLLMICQVFSLSCEIAYMVKTNCCFTNGMTIKNASDSFWYCTEGSTSFWNICVERKQDNGKCQICVSH